MTDEHTNTKKPAPEQIEYHLIKGNNFRVIHVDGGVGGITPRGFVHIALYNERNAIPKVMVSDLIPGGGVSEERTEQVLGEPNIGVVRELEVDLIFNEQTAREIYDWLGRKIEDYDRAKKLFDSNQK